MEDVVKRFRGMIPGDAATQTMVLLGVDEDTMEWWAWRSPVIGWLFLIEEEADEGVAQQYPSLVPCLWEGDTATAQPHDITRRQPANCAYLAGLYGADEPPDAWDLRDTAQEIEGKLRAQHERRVVGLPG